MDVSQWKSVTRCVQLWMLLKGNESGGGMNIGREQRLSCYRNLGK